MFLTLTVKQCEKASTLSMIIPPFTTVIGSPGQSKYIANPYVVAPGICHSSSLKAPKAIKLKATDTQCALEAIGSGRHPSQQKILPPFNIHA
jgi:hypothetical protein